MTADGSRFKLGATRREPGMCFNGCDAPIAAPSKVICRECQHNITRTLERELARLERMEQSR